MLMSTLPHHVGSVGVPPSMFFGLIRAVGEIVIETIASEENRELAVWAELLANLHMIVAEATDEVRTFAPAFNKTVRGGVTDIF